MIDLFSVFSRAFSGSCGSQSGDEATHQKPIRVKSPKKGNIARSRPLVVRFLEDRDDIGNENRASLIDKLASTSAERGSATGSVERLRQEDNPLEILERRNTHNHQIDNVHSNENNCDEVADCASFESQLSRLQEHIHVRKRGLDKIGKFLPSLTTNQTQNDEYNDDNKNNNNRMEDSELKKILDDLGRSNMIFSCPLCSAHLRYTYISSERDLVDINSGRDSPRTRLRNLMPPYCSKCQAHLLFDHHQTKEIMIENLERWLELNLNEQTKGKIIFISASPTHDSHNKSPRVTIEFTPKGSKRGSVSFSFNEADVGPLPTASSLTDVLGVYSKEVEPMKNDYFDKQSNKYLFTSDSTVSPAAVGTNTQAEDEIKIVSTESEERAILQQYSVVKDMATDTITKHLKMRYELTSDLCDRCQMPMMKMDDCLTYCIVCPVIDKNAKKKAKRKRKKLRKLQKRKLQENYATAISNETKSSEETRTDLVAENFGRGNNIAEQQHVSNGNARLTALEEGLGFIYSPKNQINDVSVSSCMSNDQDSKTCSVCTSEKPLTSNDLPSVHEQHLLQQLSSSQNSIGIEYTYSTLQQNVPQNLFSSEGVLNITSISSSSSGNNCSRTTSVSVTQCPRDLPPSQMIWSPDNNNNNGREKFDFDEVKSEKVKDVRAGEPRDNIDIDETDINGRIHSLSYSKSQTLSPRMPTNETNESFERASDPIEYQHAEKTLFHPAAAAAAAAETIQSRIARLSHSVSILKEETRDDEESILRSNRHSSFEGPLLTPHMFRKSDYDCREGPATISNGLDVREKECMNSVRVFGQTVLKSPRSKSDPLFPSPPPPQEGFSAEKGDVLSGLDMKETAHNTDLLNSNDIEYNTHAQFQQRKEILYSAKKESSQKRLQNDSSHKVHELLPSPELLSTENTLSRRHLSRTPCDPPSGILPSAIPDSHESIRRRPTMINALPKRGDPPGKRLTNCHESESVDPPSSSNSIEALRTPKVSNKQHKSRAGPSKEPLGNNERKAKRRRSRCPPPALTPKFEGNTNSKRIQNGHEYQPPPNMRSTEEKSIECVSPPTSFETSHATTFIENNVLVAIPTWVDDEIIKSPLKSAKSCGDSSVDKLIQQIDDIEADFGTIVASVPKSSAEEAIGPISTIKAKDDFTKSDLDVFEELAAKPSHDQIMSLTQAVQTDNSFDSDSSNDSVLTSLTSRIRYIHNQIDQMESSDESDDDESIAPADSQEEMLQLLNRLNNAAESLRTFADFKD